MITDEYRLACKVAILINYVAKNNKATKDINNDSIINVTADILTRKLDPNERPQHKDKYATNRDGMPYLAKMRSNMSLIIINNNKMQRLN